MTRVSTVGNYSAILDNLMASQARQVDAGDRVATRKNGTDLKAYAQKSEMLTAMRSVQTRLTAYQDQNKLVADKLATQDQALNQIADSATATRQAIADALATDRADTLMQVLQANMSDAVAGMNTRYNGKYIFAGGQIDTAPVTATSMAQLTSGPAISTFFQNDQYLAQTKLDDSTTVTTGQLASTLGTGTLTAYQAMQAFNDGGSGPFDGQLTAAQRTFLENQLATWDGLKSTLTTAVATNGLTQNRVDAAATSLTVRSDAVTSMLGSVVDADMGKAATDLQMAQVSVQAAAQVFNVLQSSSLLNFLK